jgi:hypothetical protein
MKHIKTYIAALLLSCSLLFGGCSLFQGTRIAGGSFSHTSALGSRVELRQGQDAKTPSTVNQTVTRTEEIVIPAHSVITVGTNKVEISSNTVARVTTEEKVNSENGAAQKNNLGAAIATLKSLSWLTYLGAAMIIFAIASAFWPPLKLLVNSLTTSVFIGLGGLAFILIPSLVAIHPGLLCAGIIGAILIYWGAHHHSAISSELKTIKNYVLPAVKPLEQENK